MQRLEQRSPDAILLLFLIAQTVDITMPVFALLALVAYSVSLALIVRALNHHQRVVVIDWRYAIIVFFWRMIPRRIWKQLPIRTGQKPTEKNSKIG